MAEGMPPRWDDTVPVDQLPPPTGMPKEYIPKYEDTTPIGPQQAGAGLLQVPRYEDTTPITSGVERPQAPPTPPPESDEPAPVGWWQNAKSAFGRKMAERTANDIAGMQILLPEGMGGLTFAQQKEKGVSTPEQQDYTDKVLGQGIGEGWTNPNWWIGQLAGGLGGVVPGMAAAGAASLVGGPIAGIGAFAGEAALGSLVPAYKAAVAKGMDDDAAIKQAIIDSGIASSFAVAMGIVGKVPLTPKLAALVNDTVANQLKRPIAETLVQLGVVQPGLMGAMDIALGAAHGEMPSLDQLATDMVAGGMAGAVIHQGFRTIERTSARYKGLAKGEEGEPATEADITAAAQAQRATPGFSRVSRGAEPAAPNPVPGPPANPSEPNYPADGGAYQHDLNQVGKNGNTTYGGTQPDAFLDKMSLAISGMPDSARPEEILNHLRKNGITDAELQDTFIPQNLKDMNGKVKREAIQSWVEGQQLQVWESADPEGKMGEETVSFRKAGVPQDLGSSAVRYAKDRDSRWTMDIQKLEPNAEQPSPFKTPLPDLAAKRLMQLAADRGVERVSYDPKADPALAKSLEKQARMTGEKVGETKLPDGELRKFVGVSPKLAEHIYKHGQSIMDVEPVVKGSAQRGKGTKTLSDVIQTNLTPDHLKIDAHKILDTINAIGNRMGMTRGIELVQETNPNARYRGYLYKGVNPATGNYRINVNLHRLMNRNELYASMSHEFGHVIKENIFNREKPAVQAAIYDAYDKFFKSQNADDRLIGDIRRERDNAISQMAGGRSMHDHYKLGDLIDKSRRYFMGFDEWFAEQTAKWMQTDEKPLGIVDKFFKRLGNVIRQAMTKFRQMATGGKADPEAAVRDWLNSKFGASDGAESEARKQQFDQDTIIKAQNAFDREGAPETRAVPMQGSTAGGRNIIDNLPPEVRGYGEGMAAAADTMNWFYKWALSLPQVQELNKHIRQLTYYLGMHRDANLEKNIIMGAAKDRMEEWAKLPEPQLTNLTGFIEDYAHFTNSLGESARPNLKEFTDLAQQHKLNGAAVKLFRGIQEDFDGFLEKYRNLLIADALRIKDPVRRQANLQNINVKFDELLARPFMPIAHFGKYLITVYDAGNNIVHNEHTNSLRRQRQIVEALKADKNRLPGDQVLPGMVPKDVAPFLGMPPGLIDLIGDKLSLSPTQRGMLDQLRFDYAPAQTFKHQFRNLDLVPGYSTDFARAYAHFFFHGANHVTRIKWVDAMRDQIASLGSESERLARLGNRDGSNKLDLITKYMQEHFDNWVDPKSDWAALRGLMFHFYLGMSPVAAANNLTQTALSTYPWLASKYGDLQAMRALTKASFDLNNFYKKGTILDQGKNAPPGPAGAWQRALSQLITEGTITESQAHQLAAISEDRNLLRPFGKTAEKLWLKYQDASSWMFDLSEQYNRRVAARAAWEIAMRAGMDHPAVKEAIARDPIVWQRLTDTTAHGGLGWTAQEAGAFLAAKHAVEATQFEYQPYAKPKFMQGKLGTVFVFKQFTQSMLFNLASNPGMLARWMLIMGALGGVGGMAGYENINSVLKTIAARLFGKDFDLDDEVRHFAHDVLNDGISPDILLHGLAVKGFGIPHVMHSVGANWFPTVDMSKAVGMGDVLGFDPMKLTGLAPSTKPREEELRQLGRASGAAFQIPFSIFDFASSNSNFTELKKYEPLMPHWAGAISHSYRWYTQGRETNAAGNTTIRFNPADTEHMSEIFMRALGFQPRRLTEEWARTQAVKESSDYWDLRRNDLIRQFGDTVKNDDAGNRDRVLEAIRKYNEQLPDEARGKAITSKGLQESVKQRMKVAAKQEAGIPVQKSNIRILQKLEPYYPRGWPNNQVGAESVK